MKAFRKPRHFEYNLVVIGAGSAGLVSAYIAAAVKAKVALIEKHKMGGDCLNTGCVPSKALIRSAKMLNYTRRARDFGFKNATVEFDFASVMERVQSVIQKVEPHDSVERYTQLGVDCYEGEAKVLSPYEVQVNGKTLTTRNIVVATGARPLVPPIEGVEEVDYLTSDTVWELRQQPKKLLVLGGGPIGCELAQAFHRLGSEVTIVDRSSNVLSREDADISQWVMQRFNAEGIKVLANYQGEKFSINQGQKTLLCKHKHTGEQISVAFDQVLIALGRRANVSGFGLQELGVTIRDNGTLAVDAFLRTNYHNIYACGDVAGPYQFTHTAAHQAWYAAVNALFSPFKKFKANYSAIPWATFTDPEVARVGLSEKDARRQGIAYEVITYGIDDLDRAIADSEDHGMVKVLTVPGKDKILGVCIVGAHASDIIAEYVLAMTHGIGLNKILGTIHIYPTLAEANKYAAGNWKKAHKPETLLRWVEKFHAWRR
jgi:dihydrolipoamide dehydrogenase